MATDDLGELSSELYRQWEKSVAAWWDQVLEDPAFVAGMGKNAAGAARAQGQWQHGVDRTMASMHLPSRSDVVRIAKIASLLEDRLVAMEDRVAENKDQLDRMEKEMLLSRVDAAEALLSMKERLTGIERRLDALLDGQNTQRPKKAR